MELNNKRVLVVGLGKSGVASALFLKAHGAKVTVSDTKSGDELRNEIPTLLDHGITVETGGHGERTFRGQDLIVVSPAGPNLGVLTDPVQLLVTAAQPGKVDTVIADGRVLKEGGALTTLDAGRIGRDARQALAGVLTRSRPARQ